MNLYMTALSNIRTPSFFLPPPAAHPHAPDRQTGGRHAQGQNDSGGGGGAGRG